MSEYKYILEPYNGLMSRHTCPQCGHRHRFTRYIDTNTNEYISERVGRCDRENNCNYHYTPSSFFSDNPYCNPVTLRDCKTNVTPVTPVTVETQPVQYLPFDMMDKSVLSCSRSNLYPFLKSLFTEQLATRLCKDYFIGAKRDGNTVFWQVDINANVRQAKVMQYDPQTGRRNKETGAYFAGKQILKNEQAHLQQCFFGEYFLADEMTKHKPVAIVESEKTAVIASVYYPNFIWLATGGKTGCKWTEASVCKVLAKRKVILFPDLGAFDAWKAKGSLMEAVAGCKVVVSTILEDIASAEDKNNGLDLADFLLRKEDSSGLAVTDEGYPVIWNMQSASHV